MENTASLHFLGLMIFIHIRCYITYAVYTYFLFSPGFSHVPTRPSKSAASQKKFATDRNHRFFFGMVTGHMIPDIAYQVLRDTVIDCSIILVLGVL